LVTANDPPEAAGISRYLQPGLKAKTERLLSSTLTVFIEAVVSFTEVVALWIIVGDRVTCVPGVVVGLTV
jgi:hypothetical protein